MTYHDGCSPLLYSTVFHIPSSPCPYFPPVHRLLMRSLPLQSSLLSSLWSRPVHVLTHHCPSYVFTSFPSARRTSTLAIASRSAVVQASTTSSAPRFRQITTPEPHHLIFYRLDARPDTQPTVSKHWRHKNGRIRPGLNWGPFTC